MFKLTLFITMGTALVAPTAAQAAPIVTNESGEAAQTITAFSSNVHWNTATGAQYCNETELHIELSQNDAEKATGSGSGTATHQGGTHCEIVQLGAKVVTVTGVSISHLELDGGGTGTTSFTYVYDLPGPTKCHFAGNAAVTYTPGSTSIKIAGTLAGKKIEGPGNCAAGGTIAGDLTVSDEGGGEAIVH